MGKEIGHLVYVKNKKTKPYEPGHWSKAKRSEAILTWMTTGNVIQTSAIIGVPVETIRTWRKQPWWKEQVSAFHDDDKQELDAKYQKIIRKALEVAGDRLENGNFQMDQKTGRIVRVPVSLLDSHRVARDLVQQQQALRLDKKTEQIAQESVNDKLIKLASQFAEMALGKNVKEVGTVYENELDAMEQESHLEAPQQVLNNEAIPEPT